MPALSQKKLDLPLLSIALSFSWLLPNHYAPWTSFHSEIWATFVLVVASLIALLRAKGNIVWTWPALFLLALSVIPWFQLGTGKIYFFGTAWIHSAILFGLFASFFVGYQWERAHKNQCANFLFIAIGIASVASVCIQTYQWLGFEGGTWILNTSRERPFANLGQPNQLGSLLLLGVLAILWGASRDVLNRFVGALLVAFLLFGIALTQSRTALLNAGLLFVSLGWWAHSKSQNKFKWLLVGYVIYFVVLFFWLPKLATPEAVSFVERASSEPRALIWFAFLVAIAKAPFGGYGWGQIASAQVEIASPAHFLGGLYTQAHNLILDILLWNGVLVGGVLILAIVYFCKRIWHTATEFNSLLLLLFLGVLLGHSMFEFPLHYAYFLFPAGMVGGVLAYSARVPDLFSTPKMSLAPVFLISLALVVITVLDYSKIERSYYLLRAELAKIKTEEPGTPPDVLVLNQMRELIIFARVTPGTGMSQTDLDWMQNVAKVYPSPNNFRKVAIALALNGDPAGSQKWLGYVCNIYSSADSSIVHDVWDEHAKLNPLIAQVAWPTACGKQ